MRKRQEENDPIDLSELGERLRKLREEEKKISDESQKIEKKIISAMTKIKFPKDCFTTENGTVIELQRGFAASQIVDMKKAFIEYLKDNELYEEMITIDGRMLHKFAESHRDEDWLKEFITIKDKYELLVNGKKK